MGRFFGRRIVVDIFILTMAEQGDREGSEDSLEDIEGGRNLGQILPSLAGTEAQPPRPHTANLS